MLGGWDAWYIEKERRKMPILPNEKKALDELRSILKIKYNIVEFIVFGSKAKGTDDSDSDVDVMITLLDYSKDDENQIDDLIYEINLKFNCLITALFFGKNEIEFGPVSESPVYKKIRQEGIPL